jgi:hypothetical protein
MFGVKPDDLRGWISIEKSTAQSRLKNLNQGIESAHHILASCAQRNDTRDAINRCSNYTAFRMGVRGAQAYIEHLEELRLHVEELAKSGSIPDSTSDALDYSYALFEINDQKAFQSAIKAFQSKHPCRARLKLPREAEFYISSKKTPTPAEVASEMRRAVDEGVVPEEFVTAALGTNRDFAEAWAVPSIPPIPVIPADPFSQFPPAPFPVPGPIRTQPPTGGTQPPGPVPYQPPPAASPPRQQQGGGIWYGPSGNVAAPPAAPPGDPSLSPVFYPTVDPKFGTQ